jgi:hypothetical protein
LARGFSGRGTIETFAPYLVHANLGCYSDIGGTSLEGQELYWGIDSEGVSWLWTLGYRRGCDVHHD